MKHIRTLIAACLILIAGAACQAPSLAENMAPANTAMPAPEITEPAVSQAKTISADTLSHLVISETLQVSNSVVNCAWASDGNSIAVMDMTWAGFYSPAGFEIVSQFTGDESTILYAVSPEAGLAAYSLDGASIQLYDFAAKADHLSLMPDFNFANAFFSPDGSQLAVESADTIEVVVYDTESGEKINTLSGYETAAPVYSTSFSPNGKYLLWLSRATAQPMEISSQSFFPALSHEDFIAAVKMSHDTYKVATAAAGTLNGEFQPLITLWGTQTGEAAWQTGNAEYITALDFSADDALLAAGAKDEIIFFDTSSGKEISRLKISGERISSLDFSPDGKSLLACNSNGAVAVWTIKD